MLETVNVDLVVFFFPALTWFLFADWGKHAYLKELPAALTQGLVDEADLDRSLLRLTKLQMELGLFDPKKVCSFCFYFPSSQNIHVHLVLTCIIHDVT